ncbi:DNA polymerase III subunits gamma and tau [Schaalia cardiffensis F0333]|uniref:DNA-directed DNA polymerase n=1 Tax=Schaalia cardiffensis F0333 TaxID=888050 RepID=N6W7J3_9ACTO|nr:DNA polymerase III subunit gamma and tau [Schaalia cardiffensis]ENO18520.1 DNA polymerase III subunits gamma and tau [Schaalia cardiffensis F0333]
MTTALYRRYRPDTFADVIGQDHVTGPLRAALRANKVTHAYLFSGPRGCGKTTSARILARCLNCAKGPTDTPCGSCDSCRELATGGAGSLDVVEIDAASHGGVDDARELREKATFAPVRDKYKIFIIDEAHMVTNQGFNALLKLVEEPPEHVKFVFATTEPERVIGTIRSRTHHYPFRLVPPDVLGPYLHKLAQEEHVHIAQGVLPMVMRSGGGSVRDTLSVLDQLMAGSIDNELSYETAVALLGYTDTALLDDSIDALASGNGADAYRVIERMVESGHDPRRFVEDLLQRLRDLLIIAIAGEKAGDVLSDVPADQFERMRRQGANWGAHGLSRAADLADEALRQMVGATSPRLQLELLIGRILLPPAPPSAQPLEGAADLASSADGSQENGPQGRFGAREAREALERSRRSRASERAGMSERSAAGERSPAGEPHAAREREGSAQHVSPAAPGRPSPESGRAAPANSPAAATHWPEAAVPGASAAADAPGTPDASRDPGAHGITGASTAADAPDGPSWLPANDSPSDSANSDWPEVAAPVSDAQTHTHNPNETTAHPSRARSAQEPEHPAAAPQTQGPDTSTPTGFDQENTPAPPSAPLEVPPGTTLPHSDQGADTIRERWNEVLSRLGSISRFVGTLVSENAQLGPVHGSELVLLFQHAGFVSQFSREDRVTALSDAIFEVTGIRVTVSAQTWQVGTEPAIASSSTHASAVPSSPTSDHASQRDAFERAPQDQTSARAIQEQDSARGTQEQTSAPAPQGQSGWVSEPPPFEPDEAPVAEGDRTPTASYPLDAGEDSPQDDTAKRLHSPAPESVPEPAESGFAPLSDAETRDPLTAAPEPVSPDPAQISASFAEPSASDSPAVESAVSSSPISEPSAASSPASDSPVSGPSSSAAPASPHHAPAATPAASKAHVGYTNGPKRRAISVFTYDEPAPDNTPTAFDSASTPSPEEHSQEHASAPDSPAASYSAPTTESEADAWGPVAAPGGSTTQDDSGWTPDTSAPWSPDPGTPWGSEPSVPGTPEPSTPWTPEPSTSWEPNEEAPSTWGPGPSTPWEPHSSPAQAPMSGWSEYHTTPTGVSFDDSPSTSADSPSTSISGFDNTSGPRPSEASPQAPTSSPALDDSPSLDDEDVEVSTHFGVPAVLDILGGTVIEEIYDEGSR